MPFPVLHRIRWPLAPLLGAVTTLAFAPYGQWYLGVLALALMLGLAARATPWRAFGLGWLFGFAHFLSGLYWVYISTHVYGGAPAFLGALLAFMLALSLGAFPALAFAGAARLGLYRSSAGWVGVPALWTFLELFRGGVIFGGLPWLSLGEIAVDTPLARLAPLLGVHGMSAVVIVAAFALYRLGVEPDRRQRAIAAAVLATPLATLALPLPSAWTQPAGAPVTAALIQSNIRQDEKWLPHMRLEALSRHWRLTQQAWPAQLVVWPEVALTQPYHKLKDGYLADLDAQVKARNATVLLGILVFEGPERYNSVLAVGAGQGRYDKHHLVPFGEYFPIPDFMRPLMDVLNVPYKDFSFGAPDQPLLRVDGHAVDVSICFEDVFGSELRLRARDAGYLVNVTNDAWFAGSSAPYQHLVFSRLRAMENGRWLLRAANTGISALIDPDGAVVKRTRQFEIEVLKGEVEPRTGLTPYQRWGNAPLWILSALLVAGAAGLAHRRTAPAP